MFNPHVHIITMMGLYRYLRMSIYVYISIHYYCITQLFYHILRCLETEVEGAVTPCSLALLGVQMGKALRRMTQNGAQLLLVGIRQYYCM